MIKCEVCETETPESKIVKHLGMTLCQICYAIELSAKPKPVDTFICDLCKVETPLAQKKDLAGLKTCLECHNRERALIDANNQSPALPSEEERLTLKQLFMEASSDEQLKIDALDFTTDGYDKLSRRIKQIENIIYEAKARSVKLYAKKREIDAASGKNRWDKERREENASNNSDPRTNKLMKSAKDKHKQELTKVEKVVSGRISLGDTDEEILELLSTGGKFKGHEIKEAILKLR